MGLRGFLLGFAVGVGLGVWIRREPERRRFRVEYAGFEDTELAYGLNRWKM
jgi:hypothetical protein